MMDFNSYADSDDPMFNETEQELHQLKVTRWMMYSTIAVCSLLIICNVVWSITLFVHQAEFISQVNNEILYNDKKDR